LGLARTIYSLKLPPAEGRGRKEEASSASRRISSSHDAIPPEGDRICGDFGRSIGERHVSARCVNADLKIAEEQCVEVHLPSRRVYESPKPARVARRGVSAREDARAAEGAHLRPDSGPGIIPARGAQRSSGYGVGHAGGCA